MQTKVKVFIDWLSMCARSYRNQELALKCGVMLRECFRHESLANIVMQSDDFYLFFEYVEVPTFDISSDAFSTFKVLLCYCFLCV